MMNNILEVKNLSKKYNDFELKNVSFELPKGMILGFIGENGAGKTTTIKSILNIVNDYTGEINVFGMNNRNEWQGYQGRYRFSVRWYVFSWITKP